MADRVDINMSSIRIAGVGGFGMLAMVAVVAYAMPEARQFVLMSYGAGIAGGFAFIAYRRWINPERPHGPTLMISTPGDAVRLPEGHDGTRSLPIEPPRLSPLSGAYRSI